LQNAAPASSSDPHWMQYLGVSYDMLFSSVEMMCQAVAKG